MAGPSSQHLRSRRWAVVDVDDRCAYLYLTEPERPRPVVDCWLFNVCPPVTNDETLRLAQAGEQPPAPTGYVAPERCGPRDPSAIEILWSADGLSVAARVFDEVLGFIAHATPPGISRDLLRPGPIGRLWNQHLYESIFGRGG